MNILVLNGPNLNMLGQREAEHYGSGSYTDLCQSIKEYARELGVEVCIRQSNYEGELVTWVQQAIGVYDGIVINAAAYTHTSIALLDALKLTRLPCVEVHISDIHAREAFRHFSYTAQACIAQVAGQGFAGYGQALRILKDTLTNR